MLDFWAGEGVKPDAATALAGTKALSEQLRIENNVIHRDVIDAVFRQAHSDKTIPFRKHDITKPIAAADYDLGRNRYAYSDRDTGNYYISTGGERTAGSKGHAYRNDGVDIKADNNGTYITDIEAGEWLQYPFPAPDKGKYTLRLTTAAATATGKVYASVNGTKTKEVAIPQTGVPTASREHVTEHELRCEVVPLGPKHVLELPASRRGDSSCPVKILGRRREDVVWVEAAVESRCGEAPATRE